MTAFRTIQQQFTHGIRNPDSADTVDANEARRLGVYQSLFFNNIMNFLQSGFPVIFGILTNAQGIALAREFFARHSCRSPYFAQISQEFVEFLSTSPACLADYPPWLPELAHYEWLELDVSIRRAAFEVEFWEGNDLPGQCCVSPLATLASYTYPVHLLGPDFRSPEASENRYYYVVYRDREDEVAFTVVNPLTAMLVNMIEQAGEALSLNDIVSGLCGQAPSLSPEQIESGARQTLSDMLKSGILIAGD